MSSRTLIGIPDDISGRPFRDALRAAGEFEIVLDTPASLAQRLEHRGLGGALLSPIDYARNASEYLIVPVQRSHPSRGTSPSSSFSARG
jgi:hypothetical protein